MSALRLGGKHYKWTVPHINQSLHLQLAIQKIHLHTHCRMCRFQEWGLMWAAWPSHHCVYCFSCCILKVDSQECLTRHMPAACMSCRPLRHDKSKGGPAFPEASSLYSPSLSSSPNGRRWTGINGASTAHKFKLYCWVAVPHATPSSLPDTTPPHIFTP